MEFHKWKWKWKWKWKFVTDYLQTITRRFDADDRCHTTATVDAQFETNGIRIAFRFEAGIESGGSKHCHAHTTDFGGVLLAVAYGKAARQL